MNISNLRLNPYQFNQKPIANACDSELTMDDYCKQYPWLQSKRRELEANRGFRAIRDEDGLKWALAKLDDRMAMITIADLLDSDSLSAWVSDLMSQPPIIIPEDEFKEFDSYQEMRASALRSVRSIAHDKVELSAAAFKFHNGDDPYASEQEDHSARIQEALRLSRSCLDSKAVEACNIARRHIGMPSFETVESESKGDIPNLSEDLRSIFGIRDDLTAHSLYMTVVYKALELCRDRAIAQ